MPATTGFISRMAERLKGLKGQFLLSLNDVPQVRELFADFRIAPIQTTYCSRKIAQDVSELLIMNY